MYHKEHDRHNCRHTSGSPRQAEQDSVRLHSEYRERLRKILGRTRSVVHRNVDVPCHEFMQTVAQNSATQHCS